MTRIPNPLLASAGILGVAVGIVLAQSKPPAAPKFEVDSVRLCESGATRVRGNVSRTPGRLQVACLPLYNVASIAYATDLRYPLKETGPGWIKSDAYNIEAKAEGNPSPQLMQGPMLQALLEKRFFLKIRHETKEVPVYVLTVAKNGSKLRALDPGNLRSCKPGSSRPRGCQSSDGQSVRDSEHHRFKRQAGRSRDRRLSWDHSR